jgi:hypothetical protein
MNTRSCYNIEEVLIDSLEYIHIVSKCLPVVIEIAYNLQPWYLVHRQSVVDIDSYGFAITVNIGPKSFC